MDFKSEIANSIKNAIRQIYEIEFEDDVLYNNVEIPKDKKNGDYSFPCFTLAKNLKNAPVKIAEAIKENIMVENDIENATGAGSDQADGKDNTSADSNRVDENGMTCSEKNKIFEKIENVNGFLNFYISKSAIVQEAIDKFSANSERYGASDEGNGQNIIVEFSSPNIAKPFHIGHLMTTILGHSLYNIYKYLGYNAIALNHLGDYGTQFAKMIEGYKRWGSEYDFSDHPIDKLADIYKRINQLCEDDEQVLTQCRETFKKLEDGNQECVELWQKFRELSLSEFNKIYDLLGIKFDSLNGEAFYSDKVDEVVELLKQHDALSVSQGAEVVDLTEIGSEVPFMIKKADGTSLYATRDLAAILYRTREYNFSKCLYVVANEQSVYFRNLFYVAQFLGIDKKYLDGLEHVGYGMISLPEGKMSTRKGNFVKVEDLLNDSIKKVDEVLKDRDIADKEKTAKQVGIGAIVFADQKENRIKDQVFDINAALNFNGETGPYVQYAAVRCASILRKAGFDLENVASNVDAKLLTDEESIEVAKLVSAFPEIIHQAMQKSEPSYITRHLLKLAQSYSSFYNKNKVICEDEKLQNARLYLTYMVKKVLEIGLNLLGIEVPEQM